ISLDPSLPYSLPLHDALPISISIVQTGVMFFLLSVFLSSQGLYEAFYMEQMSVYAGLIFFGMLYAPVDMILSMIMQILSRKYERSEEHTSELQSRFVLLCRLL